MLASASSASLRHEHQAMEANYLHHGGYFLPIFLYRSIKPSPWLECAPGSQVALSILDEVKALSWEEQEFF
ncbi:unnamed protein product [Strongylus vulgaris]|uniref:Uncharacterized protein n=1 Tax=Strongylus vulgaris TaxID=40348 RepID=A0A3P7L6S8_STRVU|nr:unnamed protein product [Strongylus vulgaris]